METKYLDFSTSMLFLLLGLILFIRRSPNRGSNNFLGVLFLLIAAYSELVYFHSDFVVNSKITYLTYYLPLDGLILMLMSMCLYFYVLLLLNRPIKIIQWNSLLHVIPLLPCVIFNVLFYCRPVDERVKWLIRDFYSGSTEMILINAILYLQILVYLFIGYKAIKEQLEISIYVEKNGFRTNITWVRLFLLINIIVVLISLPICFLINNERTSILIGHIALNLDFIFLFVMTVLKIGILDPEKVEEKKIPYQINEEQALNFWKILTEYMDSSKPYQNENCSLHTLAELINISEYQLSRLLHAHGGISFVDFINKYRLEEAIIYLKDKNKYRKTIDTIAIDCGFGSRSSFYRAFTKAYTTTPTDYRKQQDEKYEA